MMRVDVIITPKNFSYNFAFMPMLSFRKNQEDELIFQQVGDLITKMFVFFYLYQGIIDVAPGV